MDIYVSDRETLTTRFGYLADLVRTHEITLSEVTSIDISVSYCNVYFMKSTEATIAKIYFSASFNAAYSFDMGTVEITVTTHCSSF
jgi:hypothetical protein